MLRFFRLHERSDEENCETATKGDGACRSFHSALAFKLNHAAKLRIFFRLAGRCVLLLHIVTCGDISLARHSTSKLVLCSHSAKCCLLLCRDASRVCLVGRPRMGKARNFGNLLLVDAVTERSSPFPTGTGGRWQKHRNFLFFHCVSVKVADRLLPRRSAVEVAEIPTAEAVPLGLRGGRCRQNVIFLSRRLASGLPVVSEWVAGTFGSSGTPYPLPTSPLSILNVDGPKKTRDRHPVQPRLQCPSSVPLSETEGGRHARTNGLGFTDCRSAIPTVADCKFAPTKIFEINT